jgi:mono/diheme cytochrome c family protein
VKKVTSISGLAVHSHGAFGKDWEGAIFSMSPGTNTVGAFLPSGSFPQSEQYRHQTYTDPIWKKREFLASTDERFRPVNGTFGPDGCLYFVDFHRGVIQHKKFLTSYLRRQSEERELDKHIGYGRIYRIVPDDFKPVARPEDLVAGLSHDHLWWRLRSQQKIVEGNRLDLVESIRRLAIEKKESPFARVHAMWALEGLCKLGPGTIEVNLQDDHWFVSITALRLAGEALGKESEFPYVFKPSAKEISNAKNLPAVLSKYAAEVFTNDYPKRSANVYVDKVANWVKEDKELMVSYQKGRDLYGTSCGACHQPHGKGLDNMAPTLVKSNWVNGSLSRLIGVAVHGLSGPIKVNGIPVENVPPIMPPHSYMKDEQLADILTYVRNAWGNRGEIVNPDQIFKYKAVHKRVLPWTEDEIMILD